MTVIELQKKIILPGKEIEIDFRTGFSAGNVVGLIGPSGTGKTTILRMIAGLEKPDNGLILVEDQEWFNTKKNINLKTRNRSVGMVFQEYLLFPNMTVRENLSYAGKASPAEIDEMLDLVGLSLEIDRKVTRLSGGQQQRIALARALLRRPKILLLDEPLSALDHSLREKLQEDLKRLLRKVDIPTILVSHNLREIGLLTDEVISTEKGIAIQGFSENIFELQEVNIEEKVVILSDLNGRKISLPLHSLPISNPKPGMKISISSSIQ